MTRRGILRYGPPTCNSEQPFKRGMRFALHCSLRPGHEGKCAARDMDGRVLATWRPAKERRS